MSKYQAIAYLQSLNVKEVVADLYDDDEMFRMAVASLMPGFEYPDVSHLTVGDILKKA